MYTTHKFDDGILLLYRILLDYYSVSVLYQYQYQYSTTYCTSDPQNEGIEFFSGEVPGTLSLSYMLENIVANVNFSTQAKHATPPNTRHTPGHPPSLTSLKGTCHASLNTSTGIPSERFNN